MIEGQYKTHAGYLLITSYDCPFEEAVSCTLLNDDLQIVSKKMLGAAYSSYLLESHAPLDDASLLLNFGDDCKYKLTIRKSYFCNKEKLTLRRYKLK